LSFESCLIEIDCNNNCDLESESLESEKVKDLD
jgi:hypothetical protein